jgi:hypothetical protein
MTKEMVEVEQKIKATCIEKSKGLDRNSMVGQLIDGRKMSVEGSIWYGMREVKTQWVAMMTELSMEKLYLNKEI